MRLMVSMGPALVFYGFACCVALFSALLYTELGTADPVYQVLVFSLLSAVIEYLFSQVLYCILRVVRVKIIHAISFKCNRFAPVKINITV